MTNRDRNSSDLLLGEGGALGDEHVAVPFRAARYMTVATLAPAAGRRRPGAASRSRRLAGYYFE